MDQTDNICRMKSSMNVILLLITLSSDTLVSSTPTWIREPEDTVANVGDQITLYCEMDKLPEGDTVAWYIIHNPSSEQSVSINDRIDKAFTGIYEISGEYNLRILSVTDNRDFTRFRCESYFTNLRSKIVSVIKAVAPSQPVISGADVIEGNDAVLNCSSSGGKEAPNTKWYKDGNPITDRVVENRNENWKTNPGARSSSVLTIPKVTQNEHDKVYQCRVSNTATKNTPLTEDVKLDVKYGPKSVTVGPYLDYKVIRRQDLTLTCSGDSNPSPTSYQWNKGGTPIPGETNQNYPITNVQTSHDGTYTCTVANGIGNEKTSEGLKLETLYPPTVNIQPTYTYPETELPRTISCTADSKPSPNKYVWKKRGEQPKPDGPTLTITNRGNNGTYECTATNEMNPSGKDPQTGSDTKETFVDVQFKPGAPQAISSTVIVNTTSTAILECSLSESEQGNPRSSMFRWKKGGTSVGEHSGRYSRPNVDVAKDDDSYTCTPFNTIDDGSSATIQLYVQVKPTFTSQIPETVSVVNTDPLDIKCQDTARPGSTYRWYYNNTELLNDDADIYAHSSTHSISGKFTNTVGTLSWKTSSFVKRRSGSGAMKCKADNAAGTSEFSFNINVQFKPYDTTLTVTGTVTKVENETLNDVNCQSNANPQSTLEWTSTANHTVSSSGGVLHMGKLSRDHHGGYTCNASNIIGYEIKQFNLVVNFPSKVISLSSSSGTTIIENTELTVSCRVEGRPMSTVGLYLDNQRVEGPIKRHELDHYVQSASCRNMGTYICEAYNNITNKPTDTQRISVEVLCSPSADDRNPSVDTCYAKTGETANLVFNTLGYPMPNYTWYQVTDGQRKKLPSHMSTHVNSTNSYTHQAELIINGIQASDFGDYVCIAQNERNSAEMEFTLRARGEPDIPSIPKILEMKTAVSLYISWQPGFNNGLDQHFIVQYKNIQEAKWTTYRDDISDPPAEQFKITPLQNNTSYVFRVQSKNDEGTKGFTAASEQGTTKALPSPDELKYSTNQEDDHVVISVTAFPVDCTSVRIYCCETQDQAACFIRDINDTSITPQTVKIETEPGRKYRVSLHIYDKDDVIKITEPVTAEKRVPVGANPTPIIVGVVVGLLAVVIVLVIVFLLWKRRQNMGQDKGTELNTRRSLIMEQGSGQSNESFDGNPYGESPGRTGDVEINPYGETPAAWPTENGSANEDINPYGDINLNGVASNENFSERPVDVDNNKSNSEQDPAALYAEPDKSKKNKKAQKIQGDVAALYAQPDKVKKRAEKQSKDVPVEALYAQPDKTKKSKEGNKGQPVEALYAEPDKTKKNKKDIKPLAHPADPLYAESEKKKSKDKPVLAKKPGADKPNVADKPSIKAKPAISSKPPTPTKPTMPHSYSNVQNTAVQPEGEYAEVKNPKKPIPATSYDNAGHIPDGENPYANASSIPEGENPYANSGHIPAGDNPYQNWELPNTEPNPPPPQPDPDNPALLYADLSFNQNDGNQQSDVPARQEEPTEYAAIDFKRTGKGADV